MTVYNINRGCNEEIMAACRTLREYSMYVDQVRSYAKQMPLDEAVEKAVDHCIESDILSDFLRKNRAEAVKMSIYEYDEELHFKSLREEGHAKGLAEGLAEGLEQGVNLLNRLYSILIDTDRMDDLKRAAKDKSYQELLMKELLPEELPFGS